MEMGLTASHTDVSVFINKVLHSLSLSHLRQVGTSCQMINLTSAIFTSFFCFRLFSPVRSALSIEDAKFGFTCLWAETQLLSDLATFLQAGRIRDRREMVCNYLGIGSCDGKQLLKQLNIFNFTEAEVMHALNQLKEEQNLRTDEVNHQAFWLCIWYQNHGWAPTE